MNCLTPRASARSDSSGAAPEDATWLERTCGTRQLYEDDDDALPKTYYVSDPVPPPELWDREDARFLERVKCHAILRVTNIDPQLSTFRVRMKCHWAFRTLNSQEGAEVRWRGIPGIRMPGLLVDVEESRIWKDLSRKPDGKMRTTATTVYWRGTSTFAIHGFKTFQMKDFPFDRQVVNLERLEFVWRPSNWPEKDSQDDYYKRMQVVKFTVRTSSMLPEWEAYDALIDVRESLLQNSVDPSAPPAGSVAAGGSPGAEPSPTFASSFTVKLRIERKHWFYVRQVFFVTYLITLVSLTPLCMPPEERHMGDRLSLYGGGLLTLVAFKYGINEHLPSVPYATFTDDFLLYQILTITVCCFETLLAYRLPALENEYIGLFAKWDSIENYIFLALVVLWTLFMFYTAYVRPCCRRRWAQVINDSVKVDQEFELDNPDEEEHYRKKRD